MEIGNVGIISIIGMIFTLCVSIGVPIVLMFIVAKRTGAKKTTFLIGGATFLVFAMILEQIMHAVVFRMTGSALKDNVWLYGLYGGFAAALFEETGRWVAMHFCMKKRLDLPNALMYGVGHGGTEAILIAGLASISNLMTSVMINLGLIESSLGLLDTATKEATLTQLSALWTTPGYQFFLGGIERLSAVALHIALSVIVYHAVKFGKKQYWLLAFAVHFLVDFATAVSAKYLPVALIEVVIAALAAAAVSAKYLPVALIEVVIAALAAAAVYVAYRITAAEREKTI